MYPSKKNPNDVSIKPSWNKPEARELLQQHNYGFQHLEPVNSTDWSILSVINLIAEVQITAEEINDLHKTFCSSLRPILSQLLQLLQGISWFDNFDLDNKLISVSYHRSWEELGGWFCDAICQILYGPVLLSVAEQQRGCREFQHPARLEPMSPDSLWLASTSKTWISIELPYIGLQNGILLIWVSSHLAATLNPGQNFACRIVVLQLLKLNIKARYNLPEFLTADQPDLLLIHIIQL